MNILWLSHLLPYPPKGGVLQRSFNLLREVARYHDVYLVAFNQKALLSTEEDVDYAVKQLRSICKSVSYLSIPSDDKRYSRGRLYMKSLMTSAPFTINWLQSEPMAHLIRKTMEENEIDAIHMDTISLAPFCSVLGSQRTVLNHHNVESDMMLQRSERETNILAKLYLYQEGLRLRHYENKTCNRFDLNITCSMAESERLLRRMPNLKVEEIPNGVDVEYFQPMGMKSRPLSLVFVGSMNWYPNKRGMIFFVDEIWPRIKREIPGVNITVIGTTPPGKLVRLASRDPNFRLTGYVDDVRPYIDQAMVYVCPIKDRGGTKVKLLDALAMSKAVVADPVSCDGIGVTDGQSVMMASDPMEYVEKIKLLFNNPMLLSRLGQNGRRLIDERYRYSKIGRRLANLYSQLVIPRKIG